MANLFLKLLNMSLSAGYLVLAVVLLRLVLKKAPRWTIVLLWGLVAIRLICPFSIESALSLIPNPEPIGADILQESTPSIHSSLPTIDPSTPPYINPDPMPTPSDPIWDTVTVTAAADPAETYLAVASIIWLVGMSLMLLYMLISYWKLRRCVTTAIRVRDRIYQGETVVSPFVLGILRPRIYLPGNLSPQDITHVIAHEQAHIRRRDHWWKPLGFLLLALYWFNPLMWLAFLLLCRDIELACDEKVIKQLESDQRADYSQALLKCSVRRRSIAACPLAFGEVGVKERVKNVLSYKKPAFWIIIVAVIACAAVAVCFLTDPLSEVHAEGTQPTETQPVTVAPGPALLWYDSATATASGQMKLDTIPGITFQWDASAVTAVSEQGETVLLKALVIRNIYSADLTGDGIPEICATVDNKSGLYDCHVIVYDYAAGISYTYGPDRNTYAYYLHMADGYLLCSQVPYHNPSTTVASGRLIFTTTDDGKVLTIEGTPEMCPAPSPVLCFDSRNHGSLEQGQLQLDAFPGIICQWDPRAGSILLIKEDGTKTPLFSTHGHIHSLFVADITGDGYPDFCINSHFLFSGLSSFNCVVVYDYVKDCTYTLSGAQPQNHDKNISYYIRLENGVLMCEQVHVATNQVLARGPLDFDGKGLYMDTQVTYDSPVKYEKIIRDDYYRGSVRLVTEADGTCYLSFSSNINSDGTSSSVTGTYTKTDTHLTVQTDDGRTYTFCFREDNLVFLASSSSPLPKGSLLENGMLLTGKPYFTPEEIG